MINKVLSIGQLVIFKPYVYKDTINNNGCIYNEKCRGCIGYSGEMGWLDGWIFRVTKMEGREYYFHMCSLEIVKCFEPTILRGGRSYTSYEYDWRNIERRAKRLKYCEGWLQPYKEEGILDAVELAAYTGNEIAEQLRRLR